MSNRQVFSILSTAAPLVEVVGDGPASDLCDGLTVPDGTVTIAPVQLRDRSVRRWRVDADPTVRTSIVVTDSPYGAFVGVRRFADFQETLGVAPSVLSARLRLFTDLGVLEAADDAAGESRGYWLTPKGLAFSPTFVVLIDWANRWYNSESSDSKLTIIHRRCGATLVPQLRCRTCGDVVDRTNIHFWLPPRA